MQQQQPRRGMPGKGIAALAVLALGALVCIGGVVWAVSYFTPSQPTQAPVSVVLPTSTQLATQGNAQPTQRPANTQPPASGNNVKPTQTVAAAQPQVDPSNLPVYTVGFDAFGPYYNLILIKQLRLDEKYGFNLNLIPFCSTDDNCYGEADRTAKIASGEWDGLLTTLDKLALNPSMGQMTAFVDETDGADKFICRQKYPFNELRGKSIAYLDESIGQFMALYLLNVAKVEVSEVTLVATSSVAEAADLFVNGQVDCVSGWEPDVNPALEAGGQMLIDSTTLRVPVDVIITSTNARTTKSEQVLAFHKAWFDALKQQFEDPSKAEANVIAWGHNDWTFVANPGDLVGWLSTTPQTSLSRNSTTFANMNAISSRIADYQRVWAWSGKQVQSVDVSTMVDATYVNTLTTMPELQTSAVPVNDSFSFSAKADVPPLDPSRAGETVLAQLPFEKVEFFPDSCRLSDNGKKLILENVVPVMQSAPFIYLRLDGSAAYPANSSYTLADVEATARCRAEEVKNFIIDRSGGTVDPDRIAVDWIQPKYPGSFKPEELAADRYVRFTLVVAGR